MKLKNIYIQFRCFIFGLIFYDPRVSCVSILPPPLHRSIHTISLDPSVSFPRFCNVFSIPFWSRSGPAGRVSVFATTECRPLPPTRRPAISVPGTSFCRFRRGSRMVSVGRCLSLSVRWRPCTEAHRVWLPDSEAFRTKCPKPPAATTTRYNGGVRTRAAVLGRRSSRAVIETWRLSNSMSVEKKENVYCSVEHLQTRLPGSSRT